jgi:5-methyltetrahydrofolate--homocysteine methyltransferase
MAFDEKGQADSFERKTAICERAFKLLTEKVGFPLKILFLIPTFLHRHGIEEHNNYALILLTLQNT